MPTRIRHFPLDDNHNGWSRILPPRAAKPELEREHKANWVVIGAGRLLISE